MRKSRRTKIRTGRKEKITPPTNIKTIIFNSLRKGDRLLFLYEPRTEMHHTFLSFLNNGVKNRELCLYAFDRNNNKLDLSSDTFKKYASEGVLDIFALDTGGSGTRLNDKLEEMYGFVKKGTHSALRVLIDFGNQWNDKYKECIRKMPQTITLRAFDITSLDNDAIKSLIKVHNKLVVSTKSESLALLSSLANTQPNEFSVDLISRENMGEFVRSNLKAILFLLLLEQPLCGYDIIKTISRRFHVFLSQGTVYPLLQSLEKEGMVATKNRENSRARTYTPTEQGRKVMKNKLADFVNLYEQVCGSIKSIVIV